MGRPLKNTKLNAIECEAQLGAGGSEVTTGTIIKQVSTRRYKVQVDSNVQVCKLVQTTSLNGNEMSITATDSTGATYFVSKLTGKRATLTQLTQASGASSPPATGWVFITGASAPWTAGPAAEGTVSIAQK